MAATPMIDSDNGSVASAGWGAIRVPMIPPKATSMIVPDPEKAWATVRIQTGREGGASV